jgi:hypothetical protein
LGVAGRVADYAQTPTMHEGRGDDGRLNLQRQTLFGGSAALQKKIEE